MLEVLPLPVLPDGTLSASLEGEELVGLEFAYTSMSEEGTDLRLESRTSAHLVRIQGTQNPDEVVQNVELIAVIANQQAADAMRKAANALADGADSEAAVQHLTGAKQFLSLCAAPELASEAAALLDEHERKIRSQEVDSQARKNMRCEARYYGQISSARLYTGSGKKPGFTKKPTVDEQLNEKSDIERADLPDWTLRLRTDIRAGSLEPVLPNRPDLRRIAIGDDRRNEAIQNRFEGPHWNFE